MESIDFEKCCLVYPFKINNLAVRLLRCIQEFLERSSSRSLMIFNALLVAAFRLSLTRPANGQSPHDVVFMRMDTLMAVVNGDYRIRASLKVYENATESVYGNPIYFTGLERTCIIDSWENCDYLVSNPPDFSCYCNSKRSILGKEGKMWIYRFYFNIQKVLPRFDKEIVSVSLGGICQSSQVFEVVQFQHAPKKENDGSLKVCFRNKTRLPWIYSTKAPTSVRYQVIQVEWVFQNGSRHEQLAKLTYDKNRRERVSINTSYKSHIRIEQDAASSFFMLALLTPITNNKTLIKIIVSFNKTHRDIHKENADKAVVWEQGQINKRRKRNALSVYSGSKDISFAMQTVSQTYRNKRAQVNASNSDPTRFEEEEDSFRQLIDSVEIYPLIPPSTFLEATVYLRRTISGSVLVLCTLSEGDKGFPPVNLSLWQTSEDEEKKLLNTQQGVRNIRHLPFVAEGLTYSCGLEGFAMECLSPNELPRKISRIKSTDRLDHSEEDDLNWPLVIYGVETFIVICLLMWTVSNFLKHLRLIIWREKMILAERSKVIAYDNISE